MADAVAAFFEVYEKRFRELWQGGIGAPEPDGLAECHRLMPPAVREEDVNREYARLGFPGDEVHREFVCARGCRDLDCDGWIAFLSTGTLERWRQSVAAVPGVRGAVMFPVGVDEFTGADIVLDATTPLERPSVSIIDEGSVIGPIFSSFESLLRVLTVLLGGPSLRVGAGESPSGRQVDVLNRALAQDPEGFGRHGWPKWFRQQFRGVY